MECCIAIFGRYNCLLCFEAGICRAGDASPKCGNAIDTNAMEGVLEVSHSLELKS